MRPASRSASPRVSARRCAAIARGAARARCSRDSRYGYTRRRTCSFACAVTPSTLPSATSSAPPRRCSRSSACSERAHEADPAVGHPHVQSVRQPAAAAGVPLHADVLRVRVPRRRASWRAQGIVARGDPPASLPSVRPRRLRSRAGEVMSRRYAFAVALLAVVTTACTSAAAPGWNEFIVYPLINVLVFLYDIVRDFGVAIVVLTIVLRLALYPLFLQQLRSTRAQQEIAEEQMKLDRERGVSPMSGCLPLLIQMPILFGLYSALAQVGCGPGAISNAAHCPGITGEELGRILYPFVPNPIGPSDILSTISMLMPWGRGLAHPDNLITIPGINFSTGIYPMIAAATTLVSSLMTAPAKQPATDDPTARTMGMMVWYTPIITLLFGSQVQAGLSLYWVVTTLFSIVQQWLTSGWGRLGAMIPWLPEHLPSPAAPAMRQEEREIEREAERDLSTVPARSETRNERRRRKRRR